MCPAGDAHMNVAASANRNGAQREIGTVKFYNSDQGYGFLLCPDATEVFFHFSAYAEDDEPQKNERVTFIRDRDRTGKPRALQISRR
jgi:cold shock CspA family protein